MRRDAALNSVSIRKVDLPPPDTPVTAVNMPIGMSAVTFFRLLPRAPTTRMRLFFFGWRRAGGVAISSSPDRYLPVIEFGLAMMSRGEPCGDHLAAMDAGGGADVDDIVGGQDRVLVMLDHDDRVAEVAQVLQRVEQAGIVALVQADDGLVEHVEHAGQARADLRGQADALALAARQRAGISGHGEVVEADVVEEAQPLADLLEDAHGDLVLLGREMAGQVGEPLVGLADRHLA